jgi:hypothetical protein
MRPTTVYPAHPIGGDVEKNLKKVRAIVRQLHLTPGIQPVAPYLADCSEGVLDDSVPKERAIGIASAREYFARGMIDEVWLYGPCISEGMRGEIELAWKFHIPVCAMTPGTVKELRELEKTKPKR